MIGEAAVDSWKAALDEAAAHGCSYPLLERALEDAQPANREMIHWTSDLSDGSNYTEIKRYSWSITRTARAVRWFYDAAKNMKRDRLLEMLESVEHTLMHGVPQRIETLRFTDWDGRRIVTTDVTQTCGGALALLGREPTDTDVFRLRPLSGIEFLPNRQAPDVDRETHEWICEFSLEAHP